MEVLDKTFIRRKKSYKEVIDYEGGKNSKLCELKLKFDNILRVNVEDYFNDDEIEYLDNGDMIVSTNVPEDQGWIYNWILGYGDSIEVLEPEIVRQELEKKIRIILNKYKK